MSYANFVQAQLTLPLAATATEITLVAAVAPYQLPPATGGLLVLADSPTKPSTVEVISYTARTGLKLTGVVRGAEGTTARDWAGVAFCYQALMAGDFQAQLDAKLNKTAVAVDSAKLGGVAAANFMQIGDFGLGDATPPNITDLNAVTATGWSKYPSNASNKPASTSTAGGVVMTSFFNDTNAVQTAWPYGVQQQSNRYMKDGVWSAWVKLWNDTDLVKTTSATDTTAGSLLRVGDFGLGAQGPSITDANDLTLANGIYRLQGSTTSNGPLANASFSLINMRYDSERTQIATSEGDVNTRMFIRKYGGAAAAWGAWVEVYTAKTLPAMVSKAGDTMTGALVVPGLDIGSAAVGGLLDMHAAGGNADFDVRLTVDGQTGVAGAGRLVLSAAKGFLAEIIAANGIVSAAGGFTSMQGNVINVRCNDPTNAGNVHLWFYDYANTERALMYVDNGGGFHFRAKGAAENLVLAPDGRVAIRNVLSISPGTGQFHPDGNLYGSRWGNDYLSNFLNAYFVQRGNLPNDLAVYSAGAGGLGSFAFLGKIASATTQPGDVVAGSSLVYCSVNAVNGQSPAGNWRCMGYSQGTAGTLWQRVN